MNALDRIKEFFDYLLGKRSEAKDMGVSDVFMAKVILDIHRKRTGKEMIMADLFALNPIHPLDREGSMLATQKRAEILRAHKEEILSTRNLTVEILSGYMPSVSNIKVVQETPESYLCYEGNGRLGALHQVFAPSDGIRIEVEEYRFRNPQKIVRRLNRVRKLNGLI